MAYPVLTLFLNYRIVIYSNSIAACETAVSCSDFEMEGVNGTQSTIDNMAAFLPSRICVDLSLRLRLLAASSVCRDDMGGIG